MAKKIKKNKVVVEKEVPTNPELVKFINMVSTLAKKIIGEDFYARVLITDMKLGSTPSNRSNALFTFIKSEILPILFKMENGSPSYIISKKIVKSYEDGVMVEMNEDYEPYHYPGFDQLTKYNNEEGIYGKFHISDPVQASFMKSGPLKMEFGDLVESKQRTLHAHMYGDKNIVDVLTYISFMYDFVDVVVGNKYKASYIHTMQILKTLVVYKNLLSTYYGYFGVDSIELLGEKELFINEMEVNRLVPPFTSKFVVKLRETKFDETAQLDFTKPVNDFISFRLFEKTFETFGIEQFDINITELCTQLRNISLFKVSVVKDISKTYGNFNAYSELASVGTMPDDEWWNVKEPVVIITNQFVHALLIKNKDTFAIKIVHMNHADGDLSELMDSVSKHISVQFKYILDIFNERMHKFFRLNDKGIGTFDVEVDDYELHKEQGSRHFTPKKTIVKGHVRHYRSGVISYVLPHVRCYEGGEDSVVTLNLK